MPLVPSDREDDVASELRIGIGHARVVELELGAFAHADPTHDRSRAVVSRHGKRDDLIELALCEGEIEERNRGLSRVAFAPETRCQTPADLDRVLGENLGQVRV